ncbi:AAA domain-containing protein [Psidium guajava]|nr:AAA domain-containing protein [Psidium guajava]
MDTWEEQYCRGLAIVEKLRNACLLEVKWGSLRMHDLMRDMALQITNMTYMVKAGQGLRTIPERWTEHLEKVSLMWGRIEDIPPDMSPNCPKLSTLLLNGSLKLKNVQLQDSFFRKLRGLKVLNLSECAIAKLPDSLSELVNLRALLLRDCGSLIRIPYLGKLKCLRKLDANGCRYLSAVEGLEELSDLRYLDLAKTGIERSWEGTFSRMTNLQYLKIKGKVKAEEVIRLKALKRIECNFGNADDFNEYVRFMERRRHNNHDYELIVDQEESLWFVTESVYFDPEILPENKIEFECDDDDDSGLGRSVKIRSRDYAMARAGEERNNDSILIPGDVERFNGENWCGMINLSCRSPLRYLKRLIIEKWDNLVEEPVGGAGADAEEIDNTRDSPAPLFPSLKRLEIRGCSKLKHLFGHESRFSLPLLREVFIYDCEGIEELPARMFAPSSKSRENRGSELWRDRGDNKRRRTKSRGERSPEHLYI